MKREEGRKEKTMKGERREKEIRREGGRRGKGDIEV